MTGSSGTRERRRLSIRCKSIRHFDRLELTSPDVRFSPQLSASAGPRPDIFLFVIDSMRRDYLSVFNPAVTFRRTSLVCCGQLCLQNAFTPYGAPPSPSHRSGPEACSFIACMPDFQRSDALEKLVDAERTLVHESRYSHGAAHLTPPRPRAVG